MTAGGLPPADPARIATNICTIFLYEAAPPLWSVIGPGGLAILDAKPTRVTAIPKGQVNIVRRFNANDWASVTRDEFVMLVTIALVRTGHVRDIDRERQPFLWRKTAISGTSALQVISGEHLVATGLSLEDVDFLMDIARIAYRRLETRE